MQTFYFTYGTSHVTAVGMSLHMWYTPIRAKDEREARALMREARGDKWAFCYDDKDKAGIKRFRLAHASLENVTLK